MKYLRENFSNDMQFIEGSNFNDVWVQMIKETLFCINFWENLKIWIRFSL